MNQKRSYTDIQYIILFVIIGIILLFQYSSNFSFDETLLFIELILAYIWITALLIYAKLKFDLHVFEPISIIAAIYEGIFIFKPIIDLRNQSMIEHGISVISGGDKATLLFVLGFTIFYFSYYLNHRKITYRGRNIIKMQKNDFPLKKEQLLTLYISWIIVFILCIYCMITEGLSLQYIFSFGSEGTRSISDESSVLSFLSNLGITLVTLWLMILEYSDNKIFKLTITFLSIIYILMRNARWLMLVFIISPIVLYYIKRKKEPQIFKIVLIGFIGLTIFAWMQVNRAILASGNGIQGWGNQGFSLEVLLAPLESDLSTYRTFYSMVEKYPSQYPYMLGTTFFYALVLFIPRVIWVGKPDNPVRDMIENSLNIKARQSGTAVANIGEYYANFGLLGIMVFMYILGWVSSSLKKYVFQREDLDIYIMYSILYPLFFQWIARGNFSGNLYLTFFAVLPILLKNFFIKERGSVKNL